MDFSETGPSNLSKECEALAVSVSVENMDEIDVIGPVKIIKQLFDTPDVKEDLLSIAVQLVGQILVLHSWDASQQVTPLTWLDNEMASVPELAICYHQNCAVQGLVLLKTDKDGTPTFSPHVFQQNGLALLRLLQSKCKEDPGAYWLYKSAGEIEIQIFDLNHSSSDHNDSASPLPSLIHSGRRDSLFSLGNLLYRLGHRLSLSVGPNDRNNCARFLRKCLTFLHKPDHLVVRAYAHEQFARVTLNEAVSDTNSSPAPLFQTTSNLISLKIAAVYHVSQAIMSLWWTRHLQYASHDIFSCVDLSKCACGDPDCIVVCDIRKCLPTSTLDRKLRKLVMLLGESYLSLGEAYSEDGRLLSALNTVKLACSMYGSMPQKFEETSSVSSMNMSPSLQSKSHAAKQVEDLQVKSGPCDTSLGEISSTCVFWARIWKLVGDVHRQFHTLKGLEPSDTQKLTSINHLKMPSEVAEEVDRFTEYSQGCASILEYLTVPKTVDPESNLLAVLTCYEESRRALQELPSIAGERHKEVAAATALNIARYLRDCCLGSLVTKRIKATEQFALLANIFWQKSVDICNPENFPSMFLKILIERSDLALSVSVHWELNKKLQMLKSAMSVLLEGRRIPQTDAESLSTEDQNLFRTQMRKILLNILKEAMKSQTRDLPKLKKLYELSLRSTNLSNLDEMHVLWTST